MEKKIFLFEPLIPPIAKLFGVSYEGAKIILMSWVVVILIMILVLCMGRLKFIPTRLQNFWEVIVEGIWRFSEGMLKEHARKFIPLLCTLSVFICISNLIGTVPTLYSPTSSWSTTLALALIVVCITHICGLYYHGLKYLKRFINPINIIEHCARVLSLSLRLFANMFAKHLTGTSLALLVVLLSANPIGFLQTLGIPIILPPFVMLLGLLTCFIQTFIFLLLSLVYISEAIEEH